jgi:hypothetical protein
MTYLPEGSWIIYRPKNNPQEKIGNALARIPKNILAKGGEKI